MRVVGWPGDRQIAVLPSDRSGSMVRIDDTATRARCRPRWRGEMQALSHLGRVARASKSSYRAGPSPWRATGLAKRTASSSNRWAHASSAASAAPFDGSLRSGTGTEDLSGPFAVR